ncbi:MAG TPA: hypothetical protein VGO00_00640 [Kofleriaceae bacterium]|nr:hypothetical protein [Kofleriaceae bacterium]
MKLPVVTLVALGLVASLARADDEAIETQKMRFIERGEDLTLTTTLGKLFDTSAYDDLGKGLLNTIVIRMVVLPKDSTEPVAVQLIRRTVQYDLWDEIYTIKFDEPIRRAAVKVKRRAEALKIVTSIDDLPFARLGDLPFEQIYELGLVAELNPVSKETLAEVRRWLSQGTGGGLDRNGSFFGSFVSVFVNPKIPAADRVLRLRSQPFYRPKP